MQTITSRRHPLVVRFRGIARGDEHDLLLLDGRHLVQDAIDAGLAIRHVLLASDAGDRADLRQLIETIRQNGADFAMASSMVMDAASPVRSASEIVALADPPADRSGLLYRAPGLVIIAAGVQDPGNLGAIIRVAEAAGASGVVAAGGSANPFTWKALRGSMASALRLPIAVQRDTAVAVDDARRHGCRIVATVARGGTPYAEADFRGSTAILIGGEGRGLPADLVDAADERVSIPMSAPVESLNAATAAAIVMFEAQRQRSTAAARA